MNIILTGFMGTGKTAVGVKLAEKLHFKYIDTDELIENYMQMKISEIFNKFGEPYFRDIETKIIKQVAEYDNCVIATGGGVVLREENMNAVEKTGIVINLYASPEVIYNRTKNSNARPLLNKEDKMTEIKNLLEYRKPYYERCKLSINTDNLSVDEVVQEILKFIQEQE